MIHKKTNCSAQHLILAADCGLQCGNCLACKCGKCTERDELVKQGKAPEFGKQYRLTGGTGIKCISNGNTWKESEVK